MSTNKVVISKAPSVAVGPSEQLVGAGDTILLSSYDKLFVRTVAAGTVFLVFEHPIHDPVETIKTGLSRALTHYHPISGRLAPAANGGGFVIKCSGEGVSFVAASASCAMKDVRSKLSDPSMQDELAIYYPVSSGTNSAADSYSQPLLLLQVTVFSCGGFVVGVTWDHAVSDGLGLAQFLQAVGEMARGAPSPSVVPARTSDALALEAPPPFYADFMQFMTGCLQPCPMAFLSIAVPSSLTRRIQQDYSRRYRGRRCSAFDVVAAVLWRCRTRATMSEPEALSVIVYAENMRRHAGAREGYYGNCLTARPVISASGTVASMDVVELLEMVRREKERAPDRSDMDRLRTGRLSGYNLLRVSSWRGIGLDATDFGRGKPARVMGNWRDRTSLPLCASLPCKDDYNVISMFVREEHVRAFRRELAMMIQIIYDDPLVSGSVSSRL